MVKPDIYWHGVIIYSNYMFWFAIHTWISSTYIVNHSHQQQSEDWRLQKYTHSLFLLFQILRTNTKYLCVVRIIGFIPVCCVALPLVPIKNTQWTQNICITFVQCWINVEDVGPTLYKCYTNVLCSLGMMLAQCWSDTSEISVFTDHRIHDKVLTF